MSTKSVNTNLDTNQVMAAGLASTCAAFVTSRFGVAGTLLGAALTAMIITGGSAVLKAYIENAAGRVRGGATRLRERREAPPTAPPTAAPPEQGAQTAQDNPPGRSDLRNNFAGRMRAAIDWFRGLPTPARRPILIKALIAAGVAFVICMVAIWGAEKLIGNSLSCGLWSKCPYGAAPGIHVAGFDDSGAGSSLSGGSVDLGGGGGGVLDSVKEQVPGVPGGGDAAPSSASPDAGGEDPSSASPAAEPEPAPAESAPAEPAPEEAPSSASPAAEKQAVPEADPDASASPPAE
ncbi:MAG: hypothetical protein WKF95_03135 [Rubrobacter sp.]